MKLTLTKRSSGKKSMLKQIRHLHNVPGVLYRLDGDSVAVTVDGIELDSHLRVIEKGSLATKIFSIEWEEKKSRIIIKSIQYHPISYKVIHLDLQEVDDEKSVLVNVPVVCTHEDSCSGVKLGGQIKQVRRSVRIRCATSVLPEAFYLDLQEVGLGDVRRVSDLTIAESIRVITPKDNVLLSVGK